MEFYESLSDTSRLVYFYDMFILSESDELDEKLEKFFDDYYENHMDKVYFSFEPKTENNQSIKPPEKQYKVLVVGDTVIVNYDDNVKLPEVLRPLFMNGMILMKTGGWAWLNKGAMLQEELQYPNIKSYKILHPKPLVISIN